MALLRLALELMQNLKLSGGIPQKSSLVTTPTLLILGVSLLMALPRLMLRLMQNLRLSFGETLKEVGMISQVESQTLMAVLSLAALQRLTITGKYMGLMK